MQKKAIIAMSGGVDSSVAAYLMVKEGYDCAGATLKLYDNPQCSFPGHRACCTPSDTEDARSVAARLGSFIANPNPSPTGNPSSLIIQSSLFSGGKCELISEQRIFLPVFHLVSNNRMHAPRTFYCHK